MKGKKYDIFISYRRTAYDTANLIAEKLRHAGYCVFFDIDTLTSGKFNDQLLEVIGSCKDFVLVLPENALDRCKDTNDWIRQEVLCAIQNNKNIIPVMLDGFSWPESMPEGMEELQNYQAITAVKHEYFDMAMQRLLTFLHSKPKKSLNKLMGSLGILFGIIALLAAIALGAAYHMFGVVSKDIGAKQTSAMNIMEMLNEDCVDLNENVNVFYENVASKNNNEELDETKKNMLKYIDSVEKGIAYYKKNYPAPEFKYGNLENYVLSFYQINQNELYAFSQCYNSMIDEVESLTNDLRTIVESNFYYRIDKEQLLIKIQCASHYINAMFYGYLATLSLLPKSARECHFDMSKKWKAFPNGTPLDLTQKEYELFQLQEMSRCEDEIDRYSAAIIYEDRKLEEMEEQLKKYEE